MTIETIEQTLLNRYGPLLTILILAHILDRSPEGLRISLRNNSESSAKINAARIKIGRRVYFKTAEIAQILSEASA